MSELIANGTDAYEEPKFNFNSPETVIFKVSYDKDTLMISDATVIDGPDDVFGAASYEYMYGGFLDYVVESFIDETMTDGWWVAENVTGHYHKGDGYSSDDDIDYYCGNIRPATSKEIELL